MSHEIVAQRDCHCGEGPVWHPREHRLYWTDIVTARFFRFDPDTGRSEIIYRDRPVTGCTVQADGSLLLFMDRGTVAVMRDDKIERMIIEEIPDERQTRFNDVIADPEGRVFAGTMPTKDRPGRLYRIDRDGSYHKVLDGVECSNGMGFTPDLKRMYYTDSMPRRIYQFDYDRATGIISNQRVFVQLTEADGFPDGMTVDSEGCVWTALWDGWQVRRYASDGKELKRIELPAAEPSCPVFGGPNLEQLYVTSAGAQDRQKNGEHAGALFRIAPDVTGVPEFLSCVGL